MSDERVARFSRVHRPKPTEEVDDSQYAEQASDEMFSGPAPESVPSSYSSLHMIHGHMQRRRSSRSRSSQRDSDSVRNSFSDDVLRSEIPSTSYGVSSSANNYGAAFADGESGSEFLGSEAIVGNESAISSSLLATGPSFLGSRNRSESRSSFRFFSWDEVENAQGASTAGDEDDLGDLGLVGGRRRQSATDDLAAVEFTEMDTESVDHHRRSSRRRSSNFYEDSGAEEPLLMSDAENDPVARRIADHVVYNRSVRLQQRYYIVEEDLVIAFAGYKTSPVRSLLYTLMCVCTGGLAYLILRWFPRWRIGCIGTPCPLGQCDWIVVENQWGELSVVDVEHARYGRALSTIFRQANEKTDAEDTGTDSESQSSSQATGTKSKTHSDGPVEDDYLEYVDSDPVVPSLRWIEYRYIKFFYHPFDDIFLTNLDWVNPGWKELEAMHEGLDGEVQSDRQLVFGSNLIDIKEKSTWQLLVDEVLHPFYVFQVFSVILWSFDQYYYYASCIFLISVISVGNTLVETKQTLARLRDISRFVCDVRVLRSGFWTTIPSSELVPGDVYELSDPHMTSLPCDSLLLSGDCIVNESMLTGESVPVSKFPVTDDVARGIAGCEDEEGNRATAGDDVLAKHFLYAGTKIIRVRRPKRPIPGAQGEDYDVALAMVVRTGFATTKGSLVRSMLFPKPSGFKFYEDSFKYIGVMAIIAMIGFCVCTVNFVRMKLPLHLIIFRALDLITIVVPPALPATLTIGTNISLARLRRKNIFCISPNRINVAGKLDIMCFDKTGTLTEDGLDVLGVHAVLPSSSPGSTKFSQLYSQISEAPAALSQAILGALTTCHSLRSVDDELIGDPLDSKMFEFSGWSFEEQDGGGRHSRISTSPDGGTHLTTIKTFEFISQLRRMTVVSKSQDGSRLIYTKGAPEVMDQVCDPSTFPADYNELLHQYTHRGYRVIAVAAKPVDGTMIIDDLTRNEAEKNLTYIGFIIFENKLKPTTTGVIKQLHDAHIRTVMCTGDNVLTAISVARECQILPDKFVVYAPHFIEGDTDADAASDDHNVIPLDSETGETRFVRWESIDDSSLVLNAQLKPVDQHVSHYSLAVTGEVFRYILKMGTTEQVDQMLVSGCIFARMSPDEKQELVEKLQGLDYTTGFCGDGANDCGALKAADVGISLSEAEASVAAPFTSRKFDISCVVDLIQEGRCALATSFSCFKYMSLYSAIQFVTVSTLYGFGSNLGDFQFLWIDLFLILPIAIFMAWSKPYSALGAKRPTANLVSRKVLVPLIGEIVILTAFQLYAWSLVQDYSWYLPPIRGGEDSEVASSDNTALFIMSCLQYIFVAVILSVGPPYREPVMRNYPFVATVGVAFALTAGLLLVDPDSWFGRLMTLSYTSYSFKFTLIALCGVNWVMSWVSDRFVFPVVARLLQKTKRMLGVVKTRKRYKVLSEELQPFGDGERKAHNRV